MRDVNFASAFVIFLQTSVCSLDVGDRGAKHTADEKTVEPQRKQRKIICLKENKVWEDFSCFSQLHNSISWGRQGHKYC